jgi:hypothetical protein
MDKTREAVMAKARAKRLRHKSVLSKKPVSLSSRVRDVAVTAAGKVGDLVKAAAAALQVAIEPKQEPPPSPVSPPV